MHKVMAPALLGTLAEGLLMIACHPFDHPLITNGVAVLESGLGERCAMGAVGRFSAAYEGIETS